MRDIRSDLKERLSDIHLERVSIEQRSAELDDLEHTLNRLLLEEEARWGGATSLFKPMSSEEAHSPLRNFLLEALADGQPWTLDRLKSRAIEQQVDFGGSNPGQALHGALVSMKRSDLVDQVTSGTWIIKQDAPPAETDEASSQTASPGVV